MPRQTKGHLEGRQRRTCAAERSMPPRGTGHSRPGMAGRERYREVPSGVLAASALLSGLVEQVTSLRSFRNMGLRSRIDIELTAL
jgi:hypothetical protein